MPSKTRVFHPTHNSWNDVEGDTSEWESQGWLLVKPAHVDDSLALTVDGERPGATEPEAPAVAADPAADAAPKTATKPEKDSAAK